MNHSICSGRKSSYLMTIVMYAFFSLVKKIFENCDWKFWLGYGIQHSQWSHSMANINLHKVILEHFSLALTVFEIFTFQNTWPWKYKSRSRCTTFAVAPIDDKYWTSYSIAIVIFALSLTIYEIAIVIFALSLTIYEIAIVIFALSLTIYEIAIVIFILIKSVKAIRQLNREINASSSS